VSHLGDSLVSWVGNVGSIILEMAPAPVEQTFTSSFEWVLLARGVTLWFLADEDSAAACTLDAASWRHRRSKETVLLRSLELFVTSASQQWGLHGEAPSTFLDGDAWQQLASESELVVNMDELGCVEGRGTNLRLQFDEDSIRVLGRLFRALGDLGVPSREKKEFAEAAPQSSSIAAADAILAATTAPIKSAGEAGLFLGGGWVAGVADESEHEEEEHFEAEGFRLDLIEEYIGMVEQQQPPEPQHRFDGSVEVVFDGLTMIKASWNVLLALGRQALEVKACEVWVFGTSVRRSRTGPGPVVVLTAEKVVGSEWRARVKVLPRIKLLVSLEAFATIRRALAAWQVTANDAWEVVLAEEDAEPEEGAFFVQRCEISAYKVNFCFAATPSICLTFPPIVLRGVTGSQALFQLLSSYRHMWSVRLNE
jgi:hypothetical protein